MNDKDILLLSATYPINTGPIAPPTGDIIKKEEARLVLFPNPFKDMAKIVGNMMASNTYTKTLSARIRCIIQLPAKRPHINNPSPPNESTTAASRAFIHPSSTT